MNLKYIISIFLFKQMLTYIEQDQASGQSNIYVYISSEKQKRRTQSTNLVRYAGKNLECTVQGSLICNSNWPIRRIMRGVDEDGSLSPRDRGAGNHRV